MMVYIAPDTVLSAYSYLGFALLIGFAAAAAIGSHLVNKQERSRDATI